MGMSRNFALPGLIGLILLLLGGPAFADNIIGTSGNLNDGTAWTVHAFGNAQAVADSFRSINNFTSSSTFQSIVGLIAVLGALAVGVGGGFSPAIAKTFIAYSTGVFMICYIFFGVGAGGPLQVQVEVIDTVDNTWVAPVNVPAVVGIPASLISVAGHEITRQIEASFPIPDALKLSNGAPFNLAAAVIADASTARISDPALASSMAYYVQDCFMIGVQRGDLAANVLTTATDFLSAIGTNYVSVYVNTLLDNNGRATAPDIVSCAVGHARIVQAVNNAGSDAASFMTSASAWAKTPALSIVNSAVDAAASWATSGNLTHGGNMVKQAAMLSTFTGAYKQASAATGNSDFLTGLSITQAERTQRTGWIVGAEIFNRTMGYIYAILQVFVYAIMPLVLAAALIPGLGLALIKNFGQILLWLAIWQPMLAIVNFIVLSMQQADLGGILSSGGAEYGFSLINMGVISEKTANMRAAALFIGTMVPALAWAMVKGSVDFSKFIAEGTGEKFAASASTSMATGNYSLNSGSMDTFSANKNSYGSTFDPGHGYAGAGVGSMVNKMEAGGAALTVGGAGVGTVTSTGTLGTGTGGGVTRAAAGGTAGSTGLSTAEATNTQISHAFQQVASMAKALGLQTSINASGMVQFAPDGGPATNKGMVPGSTSPGAPNSLAQQFMGQGKEMDTVRVTDRSKSGKAKDAVVDALQPRAMAQGTLAASQSDTFNKANTANVGFTANDMRTATEQLQHMINTSRSTTATQQETYQANQQLAVTGVASGIDRLAALAAARGDRSMYLGWGAGAPSTVPGGRIAQEVAAVSDTPGLVQKYEEKKNTAEAERERLGNADEAIKKKTMRQRDDIQDQAAGYKGLVFAVAEEGRDKADAGLLRSFAGHAVDKGQDALALLPDAGKEIVSWAQLMAAKNTNDGALPPGTPPAP